MNPLWLILYLGGAFLLGSIPFGLLIGRATKGIDLRQLGSGNIGATNAFRYLGVGWGLVVLVFDVGKGVVPVVGAYQFWGQDWPALLAGMASIFGHSFSPWLGFRGGKGVATAIGMVGALAPLALLLTLAVCMPLLWLFRIVSVASLAGAVLFPLWLWVLSPERRLIVGFAVLIGLLIIVRHKENIKRLLQGKEHKLTFHSRQGAE